MVVVLPCLPFDFGPQQREDKGGHLCHVVTPRQLTSRGVLVGFNSSHSSQKTRENQSPSGAALIACINLDDEADQCFNTSSNERAYLACDYMLRTISVVYFGGLQHFQCTNSDKESIANSPTESFINSLNLRTGCSTSAH